MFLDSVWIDPLEVTAVQSWGNKGAKGCLIFTTGGQSFYVKSPLTQVVSVVKSSKAEAFRNAPRRTTDMRE